MKKNKFKYGSIGSVSHGTMRKEDLIPTFCSELRSLGHRSKELTRIEKSQNKKGYYESEESEFDLDSLFEMLNNHAMPFFYFGSHMGDGSDFGYWLIESCIEEFEGLKVSDLSEVDSAYTGELLHVNDHGNMTLYICVKGKLQEIWGIV